MANMQDNKKTKSEGQSKKREYQSKLTKQKMFITEFLRNNAMVQTTCDKIGITRKTYYDWLKDEKFKDAIDDAVERKLDRLEAKVNALVDNGDTTMTIFVAKCLLKQRGYREKQEVEVNANVNVNILNVDPIE